MKTSIHDAAGAAPLRGWMHVLLVGCASCVGTTYTDSAWRLVGGPADRTGLAVGCVDVALLVAGVQDVPLDRLVIGFRLGNRCDEWVALHFDAITVRARYANGAEGALTLMPLERRTSRWAHRWYLEPRELYVPWVLYRGVMTSNELTTVCVDLSGLVDGAGAVPRRCLTVSPRRLLARH